MKLPASFLLAGNKLIIGTTRTPTLYSSYQIKNIIYLKKSLKIYEEVQKKGNSRFKSLQTSVIVILIGLLSISGHFCPKDVWSLDELDNVAN